MSAEERPKRNLMHEKYASGPHGLGDPEDKSLRKVENEVLIPKKMREIARAEKCTEEVADFTKCCKDSNIMMTVWCRKQTKELTNCLTRWYQDEDFKARCREEYLAERTEYRLTGITQKQKKRIESNM